MKKRSETTLKTYENFLLRLRKFISNIRPQMIIDEFNETLLYQFLENCLPRKGEKLSHYTTNKYVAITRKLFGYAYSLDFINKDLTHRFEMNKTTLLPRYFQDDQVKQIIKYSIRRTYGYRWRAMVCFLLSTGCRLSEIINVKVKDFDIENELIFIKGKGNKERYIPMYDEVKQIIIKYLEMTHLSKWDRYNNGYLFSRDDGIEKEKENLEG